MEKWTDGVFHVRLVSSRPWRVWFKYKMFYGNNVIARASIPVETCRMGTRDVGAEGGRDIRAGGGTWKWIRRGVRVPLRDVRGKVTILSTLWPLVLPFLGKWFWCDGGFDPVPSSEIPGVCSMIKEFAIPRQARRSVSIALQSALQPARHVEDVISGDVSLC